MLKFYQAIVQIENIKTSKFVYSIHEYKVDAQFFKLKTWEYYCIKITWFSKVLLRLIVL